MALDLILRRRHRASDETIIQRTRHIALSLHTFLILACQLVRCEVRVSGLCCWAECVADRRLHKSPHGILSEPLVHQVSLQVARVGRLFSLLYAALLPSGGARLPPRRADGSLLRH